MGRNSYSRAGIVFLTCVLSPAGGTALGDVIPISLSQSVSGTDSPIICEGGFIGTCSSNGSSFSVSNSTVGPYSVSKSDQASASIADDFGTHTVTSTVTTDQSSDETANSISISMETSTEIEQGFPLLSPVAGGSADGTNNYSFQFDLSAPSLVHLTGSAGDDEFGFGLFPNFSRNVAFSLTGPGFDLDSTSPSSPVYIPCEPGNCFYPILPGNFDDTFSLAPGVYTFTALADASENVAVAVDVGSSDGLSLQLDFTQVPEPRWNSIVLFLLLTTVSPVVRRIATSRACRFRAARPECVGILQLALQFFRIVQSRDELHVGKNRTTARWSRARGCSCAGRAGRWRASRPACCPRSA